MWLINCKTLQLEELMNPKGLKYAILSHTWVPNQEVQYGEFQDGTSKHKLGWEKIEQTCRLALADGCDFAWVDTCCIDKKSSAELTEAINSMFHWYSESEICYAYLADYDISTSNMAESRWFTRGWTLQELIAPNRVHFYDKSWNSIGLKQSLSEKLSSITGIDESVLTASTFESLGDQLNQVPIARRMSWAANRETTRVEDGAYCLLGLFGVNIPMVYGEGERAFARLQEEIVKTSNDLSILAWLTFEEPVGFNIDRYCGVFAQRPRDFQASYRVALTNDMKFIPDFTSTNKGLKIKTQLAYNREEDLYVLDINCHDKSYPDRRIGIWLKHQGASIFARARPDSFPSPNNVITDESSIMDHKSIFLGKHISTNTARSLYTAHRLSFLVPEVRSDYWYRAVVKPESLWDHGKNLFITHGLHDFVGYHEYIGNTQSGPDMSKQDGFFLIFGVGYGFRPWVRILLLENQSRALQEEAKRENWKHVAQLANKIPKDDIVVAHNITGLHSAITTMSIHVELGQENWDGEPVFRVWSKLL